MSNTLHFKGDRRDSEFRPGPSLDGRYFVAVQASYDPEADLTTVEYVDSKERVSS